MWKLRELAMTPCYCFFCLTSEGAILYTVMVMTSISYRHVICLDEGRVCALTHIPVRTEEHWERRYQA